MEEQSKRFAARRIDRLGVHSLDHVHFSVPRLDEARSFYSSFGLDVRSAGTELAVRTFGDDHVWLRIAADTTKHLNHVSFGAFEDDLERLAQQLTAMGVDLLAPPIGMDGNGLWFRDPHGMMVGVKAAPKVMPDDKALALTRSCPAGQRGATMRSDIETVRPTRLAHALFFTPDIAASVRFYCDALGLRISDFPGPVAFLHGPHGSDHHLIAFAQSAAGIGYHHTAWDVPSFDDVGLGAAQMAEAGFGKGWGVGRHVLGSNYFYYVRDPWGSYAEYSFDIDFVPAAQDWPAAYPDPENSLFQWGPDVPEDFVTNYEKPEKTVGEIA